MNKGFTLIEILVALALLAIVSAITMASFSNLNKTNALDSSVANIVSILDEARSKTLASQNSEQYGVHLEQNQVISFIGNSYNSGDSDNVVFTINKLVEISDISLTSGGNDIIFDRLTGQVDQNGSLVVRLKSDNAVSTTVTVFGTGIIEVN